MGNFAETAWRGVKWIGNCINKVVSWWDEFMDSVNKLVYNFLIRNQTTIESSDDPKKVGEVVGIKKEKDQLEEKADNIYRTLSSNDKITVDKLLANRNY